MTALGDLEVSSRPVTGLALIEVGKMLTSLLMIFWWDDMPELRTVATESRAGCFLDAWALHEETYTVFSHLTFPSQEINSCHLTFPATTISNNLSTFRDLFFHVRDSRNPSRCHLWTMISRLGSQWQMFHHWVGLKMIGTSKWTNSNPNQLILWFQTKSPKWTWAYLSYQ